MSIQGQDHGQGQTRWSHLRPRFQSICLLFVPWQLDFFGWDTANSIFDLENSSQGHHENRPKSYQVIYRSGPTLVQKIKEIQKVVRKLSGEAFGGGSGVRTGKKQKVTPGMPGWLNWYIIIFHDHSLKCTREMAVRQIITWIYVCPWDMCEWEEGMSIVLIFYQNMFVTTSTFCIIMR